MVSVIVYYHILLGEQQRQCTQTTKTNVNTILTADRTAGVVLSVS